MIEVLISVTDDDVIVRVPLLADAERLIAKATAPGDAP